ncbi:hypothetical protein [Legionella tunisiensis]|uniref:hypothetical protein n=1 Tax=Legionella tunisiensis TaxID=1034944 RepID=UPI0002D33D8B|nr:hypothetical protein [Legionella tunisiensis]
MELLKKQTERLKLFDANIDIDFAIKWYEIKSSQFSKLAYFYGQKGWFDRQVLHGEVVAGAIVLGLAVHALAFFAVVGAYYKLSEILSDHYQVEEANKESIRKSLNGLRDELKQSIETFNEMERKLDEAFTALEEQTVNLSTTIAQLGIEAGKLHSQVIRLEGMLKQLQEQQQKMLATTGNLSDAGEQLNQEIESLSGILIEKKAAMDLVSQAIVSVVQNSLIVEKEASESEQIVTELSTVLKKQVVLSTSQVGKFDSLDSEVEASLFETPRSALKESISKADNILHDSRSIKERALRAIALKQKASPKQEESQEERPLTFIPD